VRVLIDYRPALRARSGVGEYIHQVVRALARLGQDEITLFSSSWKDRPSPSLESELPGVRVADRRVPVSVLNLAWHRLEWPPVERLVAGPFDVVHSPHPLLLPTGSAAQVVTIHDLDFLHHPERADREIRRDYPGLAAAHAARADRVITVSNYVATEIDRLLGVPRARISVCRSGAPEWPEQPVPQPPRRDGYILFVGTIQSRKNVAGLFEAYRRLLGRLDAVPKLVLAGGVEPESAGELDSITASPLAGRVEHLGYVPEDRRRDLYAGARLLVLPSFEEGFGLPVLEAMASGVPVVASNRGALPEVVGGAGLLVEPADPGSLAAAMERLIVDLPFAARLASEGVIRAREFTWRQTADAVRLAYTDAMATRHERAHAPHAHRH
jgi:glycosyltransferase involved in cell wall biosynthesis